MKKRVPNEKKEISVVNLGTSSMVVILVGLCFAVLTALTVSSARNDYVLSKKLADHTFSYYQAVGNAQKEVAQSGYCNSNLAVQVDENLWLCVDVLDGEIVNFFEVNDGEWNADNRLPLLCE